MLGLAPLGAAPVAARKPAQIDHTLVAEGALGLAGLSYGRSDAAGAGHAAFGFSSSLAAHLGTSVLAALDVELDGSATINVASRGRLQGEVAFALQTLAAVQAMAFGVSALRLTGRAQAMGEIAVRLDSDVAFEVHSNGAVLLNGGGARAVGLAGSADALAALRAHAVYGEMAIAGFGRVVAIVEGRAAAMMSQTGAAAADAHTAAVAQQELNILPVVTGAIASDGRTFCCPQMSPSQAPACGFRCAQGVGRQ